MSSPASLWNYLYLALVSEQKQQLPGRDRFLILAMQQAAEQGYLKIAETCRAKILQNNPRHLVAHYSSAAEALRDPDFQFFVKQQTRNCSSERAEQLALGLGFEAEAILQASEAEKNALLKQLLGEEDEPSL